LKELVLKNLDRYHGAADLSKKKDILKEIVAGIPNGGRFLQHDGSNWVVIPLEKALLKTAQALQHRLRAERNIDAGAAPTMHPLQRHAPVPVVTREALGVDDPPDIRAQKTLKLYSQWMVRANEMFWQQVVGPEARALFPDDMIAAVPMNSKSETSFPTRS
jgi:hypothetical protein